jgi:integrase
MIIPLHKGKQGKEVAVFSPMEWHLIESKLNTDYRLRGNFLLYTGMRISEAIYVSRHPKCFREEHGSIFLPYIEGDRKKKDADEKLGKPRAKQKDRTVLLSKKGIAAVKLFFEQSVTFPSYQAMEGAFKRAAKEAGFDTRFVHAKALRKTWVSWLMMSFPGQESRISLSMGHDRETMQYHYLVDGFRKEDRPDIKEETAGWGEA